MYSSFQYLSKVVQGKNSGEPAIGSWVAKSHCTWGSEGWPMWSDPTELLLLKLLKKLRLFLIERCQNTQQLFFLFLRLGLHSHRPVRVPMLTPVHRWKCQQWAHEHQNWTTEQWEKVVWSDESCFLLHQVDGRVCVSVAYLGNTWHQDALWEESKLTEAVWCFWKCSAGKPWVLPSMWMLLWHVPST